MKVGRREFQLSFLYIERAKIPIMEKKFETREVQADFHVEPVSPCFANIYKITWKLLKVKLC
jgi:hypothetical protein